MKSISNNDNLLYTRKQFCKLHNISTTTLFRLLKLGKGPKIIRLDGKILISKQAAEEWVKSMESNSL